MAEEKRPKKKSPPSDAVAARSVVVTVDDAHMTAIGEVAERLRALGMHVDEVLEATGLICGTTSSRPSELRTVPGVMSVEDQPNVTIPPPESPIH
jgi:hypothetical protein